MRETPDELDPARRPQDRYGAVSSASLPPLGGAARHAYDPNQPRRFRPMVSIKSSMLAIFPSGVKTFSAT